MKQKYCRKRNHDENGIRAKIKKKVTGLRLLSTTVYKLSSLFKNSISLFKQIVSTNAENLLIRLANQMLHWFASHIVRLSIFSSSAGHR